MSGGVPLGHVIDRLAVAAHPQASGLAGPPEPSGDLTIRSVSYMAVFGVVAWGATKLAEAAWTYLSASRTKRRSAPRAADPDEEE